MHKFGYTEEVIQTRITEGMREKRDSHEKLALTKAEKLAKNNI